MCCVFKSTEPPSSRRSAIGSSTVYRPLHPRGCQRRSRCRRQRRGFHPALPLRWKRAPALPGCRRHRRSWNAGYFRRDFSSSSSLHGWISSPSPGILRHRSDAGQSRRLLQRQLLTPLSYARARADGWIWMDDGSTLGCAVKTTSVFPPSRGLPSFARAVLASPGGLEFPPEEPSGRFVHRSGKWRW